jgi:hypothetical protein
MEFVERFVDYLLEVLWRLDADVYSRLQDLVEVYYYSRLCS